jgi:hypothetical protein
MSAGAGSRPGPQLTIERLRLRASGLDEGAARQLARCVAEGLAASLQLPPGVAALEALRVEVTARAGEAPDMLSRRIIDAVGRALARDRAPAGAGGTLGDEEVAP